MRTFVRKSTGAPPWVWTMARHCLDWQTGNALHFPAGTYYEQEQTETGRAELSLMSTVWQVWHMFKAVTMKQWGESERRLARWMMDDPPQPTRHLDAMITSRWGLYGLDN